MRRLLIFLCLTVISSQAWGGTWSPNNFLYKPSLGARGAAEKASFDGGLDRLDARLGKETWVGDPNYGTTFSTVVTAIGANNVILRIPAGTHSIAANLTVPANITLKPERGATLAIADGKTLTINGGLEAGPYQIFSCAGTGKVEFGPGSIKEAYPEWWGAVADGATDCSAAIQAAVRAVGAVDNSCGTVSFGSGTYVIDNTTIYLDTTSFKVNYRLKGSGYGTIIKLKNYTTGYAFKLNEDTGGTRILHVAQHPHLVIEDLYFLGTDSTNASVLWVNNASAQFNRVQFRDILYGCRTTDYCDDMAFRTVYWADPRSGGWLYWQGDAGDGFVADQVFAGEPATDNTIHLYKCGGGIIRNSVQGHYLIDQCHAIIFEGHHFEMFGGIPLIIKDSHVTIRNSLFGGQNTAIDYAIQVDDTTNPASSRVVIENNQFPWLQYGALVARNVELCLNLSETSQVILRNNHAVSRSAAQWRHDGTTGIKAVSTSDANLNTMLTDIFNQPRLSGEVEIYQKNGAWKLRSFNGQFTFQTISGMGITNLYDKDYMGTLTPTTTYYYQMAVWNGAAWTTPGTERSLTAVHNAIQIIAKAKVPYVMVRIWRGTSTGSYDRYVNIPFSKEVSSFLVDHGDLISGYAWITTGVPAVPIANNTYDGLLHDNGTRTFWKPGAFVSGEFTGIKGDRVINNAPTVGQPKAWTCTAAGSPGTWVSEGNL